MRWVRRILVALLLLVVFLGIFGFVLARRSFPVEDGDLAVPGLEARVEIIRDRDGVPHVYAETEHDLFFAQGYVHAQDRFWQMDVWRHIGAGRLSEMFGGGQVETDMFLRSLGFTGLAEQELTMLSPGSLAVLEAYAEGVNAYLEGKSPTQVSFEYGILPLQTAGYRIEPWTSVHTLTWGKVMSWDLSWNLLQEIDRANLSAVLPVERVEQLYPAYPEGNPVVVPAGATAARAAPEPIPAGALTALAEAAAGAKAAWSATGGGFAGIGSNNWVVGGAHTASGMPILGNDPHLAIQMPSIWYQNGLHCVEPTTECPHQLVGFSFAGTPGVIIGHNQHIAWGVTNEAVDTQDLYIERLNPEDPTQYEFEGEWVPMDRRTETIVVAGGEDVTYDVLGTRHGPVISDTYFEAPPFQGSSLQLPDSYAVSLAWQTLRPSHLVDAILGLNRATDYQEFRAALADWDIAGQNVVYADTEGNIAYQSTSKVPIRPGSDGRWPVPGWDGEHEWAGTIPYEEMPRLFNPQRGFIATANQPVLSPPSDPYLTGDFDLGYRAARIEEMLEEASGSYTVETAREMQMDGFDGGAPNLVPRLLAIEGDSDVVADLQSVLEPWSVGEDAFQTAPGSPGAAAYQAIWVHLLRLTFHDELPEDSWPEGGSRWFEVVASLLEAPDDPWWDDVTTDTTEDRDQILAMAMTDAHAELVDRLGDDPTRWRWSDLHTASFENQTLGQSGIAPVEWLFNRGAPRELGGGADIVNAVGFYPPDGYVVDWIPSMRMVIDLGDLSASTMINSTGQSGHAFHRHYDDMLQQWARGEQNPMRWTREQVTSDAAAVLNLEPAA